MSTRHTSGIPANLLRIGAVVLSFVSALIPALILAFTLAGCASWCSKGAVHAKIPARNATNAPDCACSLEYRKNLCVTVNGSESFPSQSSLIREHEDGVLEPLDTAFTPAISEGVEHAHCFGELRGIQRIFLWRNDAVVDSTGWFEIPTVDCCHGAAKTVDFKVRK